MKAGGPATMGIDMPSIEVTYPVLGMTYLDLGDLRVIQCGVVCIALHSSTCSRPPKYLIRPFNIILGGSFCHHMPHKSDSIIRAILARFSKVSKYDVHLHGRHILTINILETRWSDMSSKKRWFESGSLSL